MQDEHLNFMVCEEEEEQEFPDALGEQEEKTRNPGQMMEVSLHTLSNSLKRKTIILKDRTINVLLDTGSFDGYIHPQLVNSFSPKYQQMPPVILKKEMSEASIMRLPDFSKGFVIVTDAYSRDVGVVLMQEGQPIAFLSNGLSVRNFGLSIYEKELLAVKLTSTLQHRLLTKLLGLDYEIQYKRGLENRVANALSRRECAEDDDFENGSVMSISSARPEWITEVLNSYEHDVECQQLLAQLTIAPDS
ncbi:hypothetical protein ACH5RR_023599 [Cinchona calisaya]|uniref:Reverse transcriptase/retrotransposon-derived protein RNase H-like domain-containing protein n=1 Tax=Cinchona calisaya TaxID=153742 RepID=A0ABD2ZE95_9GENT